MLFPHAVVGQAQASASYFFVERNKTLTFVPDIIVFEDGKQPTEFNFGLTFPVISNGLEIGVR
jgi:hypothetical protein